MASGRGGAAPVGNAALMAAPREFQGTELLGMLVFRTLTNAGA